MPDEINFDGLVGPTHNYAGLSPGNLASMGHAGAVSRPRAAALQGVEKMRANLALGLIQGVLPPLDRPNEGWLARLSTSMAAAEPHLRAAASSASAMWAANAATVSPAPDTTDGRCHLTVANLQTMAHRSHEWPGTLASLRLAFPDPAFAVHGPVPSPYGDEGAANHMRLAPGHAEPGVEIFVHGQAGGPFPARQSLEASKAVARTHGLDPDRTLFLAQSEAAIAAGAFHNDVVAVADERLLLAHARAFAEPERLIDWLAERAPWAEVLWVGEDEVSLADAISSYLFNAQLVTLPSGEQALIVPAEVDSTPSVRVWLDRQLAGNGPIRRVEVVDLRESMANGGGPACLRLRVVCDPARIDPRFLVDEAKLDRLAAAVEAHWPEELAPGGLRAEGFVEWMRTARLALLDALDLSELA